MKLRFWFSATPIIVSSAIGAAVASIFNLTIGDPWSASALKGAVAGILIGLAAECAFIATARWINRKPVLSFVSVILVIASGTALCLFLSPTPRPSLGLSVAIVAVSELAGISATALFWRASRKMNDRLVQTKKHFTGR